MLITKIKLDKKNNMPEIHYNVSNREFSKETKLIGTEEPRQEFIDAFRNMDRHLVTVLPFLKGLEDVITVTGLSITYDDDSNDLMGMVITAQLAIEGLNAPMNINTPFITFFGYEIQKDNSCVSVTFSERCKVDLEKIFDYAENYMNGDTAMKQLRLVS